MFIITIYIHKYYILKKSEGKRSTMNGIACSLSGMMSMMLAKAVALVDELWEVVIRC
jgi:hypothetical protein